MPLSRIFVVGHFTFTMTARSLAQLASYAGSIRRHISEIEAISQTMVQDWIVTSRMYSVSD